MMHGCLKQYLKNDCISLFATIICDTYQFPIYKIPYVKIEVAINS